MRRPFATIGFSWLLLQWVSVLTRNRFSLLFSFLLFITAIILVCIPAFRKNRQILCALLAGAASLLTCGVYDKMVLQPAYAYDGETVSAVVVIESDAEKSNGQCVYLARVKTLHRILADEPGIDGFRIRLTIRSSLSVERYDTVIIDEMDVSAPEQTFGYSSAASLAAEGVCLYAYCGDLNAIHIQKSEEPPWTAFPLKLREKCLDVLYRILPERETALCGAIALGDKSGLSEEMLSVFRTCGLSHLLVVSGLHVSLLSMLLLGLWKRILPSPKVAGILTVPGLILFMAINEFTPSVIRAGIMMLLYIAASLFDRNTDSLNSLGIAAFVLALSHPQAAGSVGLQLSFLASLGIILYAGRWAEALFNRMPKRLSQRKWLRGAVEVMTASVSAQLFTFPILVLLYGEISLLAPLTNVVVAVLISPLLTCTLLTVFLGLIPVLDFLAPAAAFAAGLLAKFLMAFAEWVAEFAPMMYNKNGLLTGYVLLLFFFGIGMLLLRQKRKRIVLLVVICMTAMLWYGFLQQTDSKKTTVIVPQYDDGTAVSLQTSTAGILVLTGGEGKTDENFLRAGMQWDRTDLVILPDSIDQGAQENAIRLLQKRPVSLILAGKGSEVEQIRTSSGGATFLAWKDQMKVQVDEHTYAVICCTEEGRWCVLQGDTVSVLIQLGTGSAEAVPEEYRNPDILILTEETSKIELLHSKVCVVSTTFSLETAVCMQALDCAEQVASIRENGDLSIILKENGWEIQKGIL